jgi:hypothetical protein
MAEISKKILLILQEVDAIAKSKTNTQQNYKFRGIDDMYNALHPLFSKHGVYITSEVLSSKREERQTKSGGVLIYTIVTCKFNFNCEDSSVSSILEGEAMDSGDKSTNKAMSTALKYALMQMFLIPTEEQLDTETKSPDPAPKKSAKPALAEEQLNEAIKKIKNGWKGKITTITDKYDLTKEQNDKLQEAWKAR